MALNWTMLDPATRVPIPLPHEQTILTVDSKVEYTVIIPKIPPSGSAIAGGSPDTKKMKEAGRLWLTDKRLIFTTPTTGGSKPSFDSLSIPLHSILSTKFEQPLFAANFLTLDVDPSPEGGLTDGTKIEIRFSDQGIFQFVGVLDKTRERTIYMRRQTAMGEDENLPVYSSSAEGGSSTYTDMPPGYDA
ncbi:hypothetical protein SERLA73DRAFT_166738 [Serpula lacrymans var. lacrymans S7.3]|uniref:Uncharacterized protein n=1 Tax=Serpula lacrymans var. lacrymans (strain S7.3) TaxID=936435 RepID=F8PQT5_SERL3|nr:hypothetical protein SERLA73DRAFT_166738 [Serpula lacrymans var. lacrymans S7.3]